MLSNDLLSQLLCSLYIFSGRTIYAVVFASRRLKRIKPGETKANQMWLWTIWMKMTSCLMILQTYRSMHRLILIFRDCLLHMHLHVILNLIKNIP